MPINPRRISHDIDFIADCSEVPRGVGHSRPTFSPAWVKARDYVIVQAEGFGCKTRIDAAGNLHVRPAAIDWPAPVVLSGSHIDSVPTGGKYDGVVGVSVPLEVLRSAHEDGQNVPLELIVFAEEEGTTFGLGMIGSRLWTRSLSSDSLVSMLNRDGKNYFQAGEPCGVRPGDLAGDSLDPSRYRAFVEIHIEQGPGMAEAQIPIAVVTAISGRKQYRVELKGVPNHAGSTPMQFRSDALVAAAKMICDIQDMAGQISDQTVATVGRIECVPNAINVIPGNVTFTIDLRSPSDSDLARGHQYLQNLIADADADEVNIIQIEDQPVMTMHSELIALLRRCGGEEPLPTTISGALHDAAILAPCIPTAMVFVASKDGISHNPAELSRLEDITEAARILQQLVQNA